MAQVQSHADGKAGECADEERVDHEVGIIHFSVFDLNLDGVTNTFLSNLDK